MELNNTGTPRPEKNIYEKMIALLNKGYLDIRKNITLFLVCMVVCIGIFVYLNIRKGSVYHSSFTVVYEELVRKVYGDRLDKVNTMLKENNRKAQQLLGLNSKEIATLVEIEGKNILGDKLSKDLNTDRIPFVVHLQITDTTYLTKIQRGIVNYLENGNAYLIDKRKLRTKEIADEVVFIEKQLYMMDTLKKKYHGVSGAVGTAAADKSAAGESSVYQISYDMYKKRQELLKKQEMPMNLYVIDDAIVPTKSSQSYIIVSLFGIVAGFIVYMGFAYIVLPVLRYKEH